MIADKGLRERARRLSMRSWSCGNKAWSLEAMQ
jgi:hypothetical protein